MEPHQPPSQIEFVHRRVKTDGLSVQLSTGSGLAVQSTKLLTRARITRGVIVTAGAVGIAFGTQRAGIPLPQALCLFFGALPVLWVGGWVVGAVTQVRRAGKQLAAEMGSSKWRAELEAATVSEQVKLAVQDDGLSVLRDGLEKTWAFSEVSMNRLPGMLLLSFGTQFGHPTAERLEVPESAFQSGEAFDGFCLLLQGRLWAAERAALTNRRA